MIPKLVLQVSKTRQSKAVVNMLMKHFPGYTYLNYTDKECIDYMMKKNRYPQHFPQIIERFNSFQGAHKADLFRYFFLYQEGGIFVDSDMMIYVSIDQVLGNSNPHFVSIRCYPQHEDWIFNGFMAVTRENPIMWNALVNAYSASAKYLATDYFYFVRALYDIVKAEENRQTLLIYQEYMTDCGYAFTPIGENIGFRHFFRSKIVPTKPLTSVWRKCEKKSYEH
ncbi:hypothetical protein EBS02_06305 [bacterium]|nr:hypothetical protein [bacterium]